MTKQELLQRIYEAEAFLDDVSVEPRGYEYETVLAELDDLYAELEKVQ